MEALTKGSELSKEPEIVPSGLLAAWFIYQRELEAFFKDDPDVDVGQLFEGSVVGKDTTYYLDVIVRDAVKAVALDRILNKEVWFGDVTLGIGVVDKSKDKGYEGFFDVAFKDNPYVKNIVRKTDAFGQEHTFIVTKPEVVQIPADNTGDLYGYINFVSSEIAMNLFISNAGTHFCIPDLSKSETEE